ncbi:hypothetical protein [uncultured Tenacibaculum sp.]|uniref:hypothetical protein n=1 Tax=uncultured Tenacibaculum sp. TaxID=174713 RepID=UPI002630C7D4|nr:hypothetical protein [uncultured Tenacibaculum sp.]
MNKLLRKKAIKFLLFSILLLVVFLLYNFYSFSKVKKEYKMINESSLKKYLRIYDITNVRPPENLKEFKDFIKKRNPKLYSKINGTGIQYLKFPEINYGQLYLKGFDNKNDSLNVKYDIDKVNFLNSLIIRGDVELKITGYRFKMKLNKIYKVTKDTIKEVGELTLKKIYQDYYSCNELSVVPDEYGYVIDESDSFKIVLDIKKDTIITPFISGLISEKTEQVIFDKIKKTQYFLNKNEAYTVKFKGYNIENFECNTNR